MCTQLSERNRDRDQLWGLPFSQTLPFLYLVVFVGYIPCNSNERKVKGVLLKSQGLSFYRIHPIVKHFQTEEGI